ncbi:MAG: hypothetical protein QM692_08095 [Thermomicrobiales bacterium]
MRDQAARGASVNLFANAGKVIKSTITNCTFTGNTAASIGGGIFIRSQSVDIASVTLDGNRAENGGGNLRR